jgi:hypothetical protein
MGSAASRQGEGDGQNNGWEGRRKEEEKGEFGGVKKVLSFQASHPVLGGGVTQALHRRSQLTFVLLSHLQSASNEISWCAFTNYFVHSSIRGL